MAGIEKAGTDNMDIEFEDSQIKRNTTMAVCWCFTEHFQQSKYLNNNSSFQP